MHANNAEILAAFAERGMGVLLEPDFVVAPQVRAGTLVPILPGYAAATIPVHAVYPSRRHLSAKVRAFIDFLVARFAADPAWNLASRRRDDARGRSARQAPTVPTSGATTRPGGRGVRRSRASGSLDLAAAAEPAAARADRPARAAAGRPAG